jgi:hypothetical protein
MFQQDVFKSWYVTGLCLLCVAVWWIGQTQTSHIVDKLAPVIVESHICETSSGNNTQQFFIYGGGKDTALKLNDLACNHAVVNRQFGAVKSFWHVNDIHTLHIIGQGIADLAVIKENMFTALKAEQTHGYQKIATYPQYQSFFIARSEKPVLDKTYFLDKTIGLINYPTSRSGHIIPKQVLSELGLSLDKLDIVYASSHNELRELLSAGKVDLIASFWQSEDKETFSSNYKLAISSPVSGLAWYLKLNTKNEDLVCATQSMLKKLSQQQTQQYYRNLELLNIVQCEGDM